MAAGTVVADDITLAIENDTAHAVILKAG